MKRIQSIIFTACVLLASPAFFSSCHEDATEVDYTLNMSIVNDFNKVAEAIDNGSLKNEEAIKALMEAIDRMNADEAAKLQVIADVLNSADAKLETKLAAIEAALKSQTLSLESKLSALEESVKSQTLSLESKLDLLEKAVKALAESIDKMNADQATKLQAVIDALGSVNTSLETKLAALEASVRAWTVSLEGKLDLLKRAIEGMPDYSSRLEAIEAAVNALPDYSEKLAAIEAAVGALPDYGEKFDAVVSALGTMEKNLSGAIDEAEKELAGKIAGVSAAVSDIVRSVDNGTESAASALERILERLDELKEAATKADDEEYVDLGLSVKWAKCNLGAEQPSDYGDYYAWAETEPKADYSWETYKWMPSGKDDPEFVTKYNNTDGKTILDAEDDAATVKLGSPWRMPTKEEFQELLDRCATTYVARDGVNGLKVSAPNGKSIFLPAAGCYDGSRLEHVGVAGLYRSSSLGAPAGYAWSMLSNLNVDYSILTLEYGALYGFSVRPVHP